MQRAYPAIVESGAGGEVVVISFEPPERLPTYIDAHGWRFPVVSDPSRESYKAFGLGSADWRTLLGPKVVLKYAALLARGYRPRATDSDVRQLGGDFVIDAGRRIVFGHRSNDPADRPSAKVLLRALRASSADPRREAGGSS